MWEQKAWRWYKYFAGSFTDDYTKTVWLWSIWAYAPFSSRVLRENWRFDNSESDAKKRKLFIRSFPNILWHGRIWVRLSCLRLHPCIKLKSLDNLSCVGNLCECDILDYFFSLELLGRSHSDTCLGPERPIRHTWRRKKSWKAWCLLMQELLREAELCEKEQPRNTLCGLLHALQHDDGVYNFIIHSKDVC